MNKPLLVLLDSSAAFGTFDHSILLDRLYMLIDISSVALHWFKSYLTEIYLESLFVLNLLD